MEILNNEINDGIYNGHIFITNYILQLNPTNHVMRVGYPKVVVKALLGWKKFPLGPKSQVPLSNGSSGVAHRLQDFSDGGLIKRETTNGAWVQHSWIDARASLITPS